MSTLVQAADPTLLRLVGSRYWKTPVVIVVGVFRLNVGFGVRGEEQDENAVGGIRATSTMEMLLEVLLDILTKVTLTH